MPWIENSDKFQSRISYKMKQKILQIQAGCELETTYAFHKKKYLDVYDNGNIPVTIHIKKPNHLAINHWK